MTWGAAPTLLADSQFVVSGADYHRVTLAAPIPAGTPLAATYGSGSQPVITSVTDSQGNDWSKLYTQAGQRSSALAVCEATTAPLGVGDWVSFNGVGANSSPRGQVFALPEPPRAVPGSGYTINGLGTAVGLSVPDAVAGELILAVWLMAGNLTITAGGNWQGIASFNTPTLRLLWRVATGPETFAATMSGSNAWSICAGRFVPATPAPLKAWDGSSWRAVART